jgi:hypothetical protein
MRNHWLRKKVAKEEFSKCICRISYSYGSGVPSSPRQYGYADVALKLKLNWTNCIYDGLSVIRASILDKNHVVTWTQSINMSFRINSELMLDFEGLIINGYKAKDLFK